MRVGIHFKWGNESLTIIIRRDTINTENELVVEILDTMARQGSPYKMGLASSVLNRLDIRGAQMPQDIYHAIWQACAVSNNTELKNKARWLKAGGAPEAFKPAYYNIAYTGLIQDLQNRSCWAARRLLNDRNTADIKAVNLDDYGIDRAMETEEEVHLDSSSIDTIRADLDSIFEQFTALSCKLVADKNLQLGNVEPIVYFAPQVKDDDTGEWSVPRKARTFDDAFALMDEISAELKSKVTEKVSLDYYANEPVKAVALTASAKPDTITEELAPRSTEPDFVDDEMPF